MHRSARIMGASSGVTARRLSTALRQSAMQLIHALGSLLVTLGTVMARASARSSALQRCRGYHKTAKVQPMRTRYAILQLSSTAWLHDDPMTCRMRSLTAYRAAGKIFWCMHFLQEKSSRMVELECNKPASIHLQVYQQ